MRKESMIKQISLLILVVSISSGCCLLYNNPKEPAGHEVVTVEVDFDDVEIIDDELAIDDYVMDEYEETEEEEDEVFMVTEVQASFVGGDDSLFKFISDNIKYPEQAIKDKIEGTAFIRFIVEKDGSLSNIEVLRPVDGGCSEEAVRIVKMMPNWNPAKQRNRLVRAYFVLPIEFKLDKK